MDSPAQFRRRRWVWLFLICGVVAVYAEVRHHEFVNYDDDEYVTNNEQVRSGFSSKAMGWAFRSRYAANWHPLTWLSHMLDCELFGLHPAAHHVNNVLIHAVNTVLLALALKRMTGSFWPSTCVACLFAFHPINVQSVAWIAERKNVLSTFFWMLAMLAYARYVRRPGLANYSLVAASFGMGLMAKPMLVVLPFVLLLLDYWPLGRMSGSAANFGRLAFEKSPLFVLSAASSIVTVWAQAGVIRSFAHIPFTTRTGNGVLSYFRYLKKAVWPNDLAISYPYPESVSLWTAVACVGTIIVVTWLFWRARKRHAFLIVGWLWYLGTLVPVLGLLQVGRQSMADRYAYVALIGVFVIVAWGCAEICTENRGRERAITLAGCLALLAFMARTKHELKFWSDSVTLSTRALAVTEANEVAHNNLGVALAQQRSYQNADHHLREAVRIDPDFAAAHYNLAQSLAQQQRYEEAAVHFAHVLRTVPGDRDAIGYLSLALERTGNFDEGVRRFHESLATSGGVAGATRDLAWVLATHEDPIIRDGAEAVRLAERAVELTSHGDAAALDALAAAYAEVGRFSDALTTAKLALKMAADRRDLDLEQAIRLRIELFSRDLPYRGTPSLGRPRVEE